MNLPLLVLKEIRHTHRRFLHSGTAVVAGISILVAVELLAHTSYTALMEDLHDVGPGYMVIAQGAHATEVLRGEADELLPEDTISRLVALRNDALATIYPRIYRRVSVQGHELILTGVYPPGDIGSGKDEDVAAAFLDNVSAGHGAPKESHAVDSRAGETSAMSHHHSHHAAGAPVDAVLGKTGRPARLNDAMFDELGRDEVILGASAASSLGLHEGDTLAISGRKLKVKYVLESTGDRDDVRLFVHIRTAQAMLGLGRSISSIEILGCCVDPAAAPALKADIDNNIDGIQVVTIEDVARTRMNAFSLSRKVKIPLVLALLAMGAGSVAAHTVGSLRARCREIGMLVAMGAGGWAIQRMFLSKAIVLGALSGTSGFVLGTLIAWPVGRLFLGSTVTWAPWWFLASLAAATVTTVLATAVPVFRATRREPALILMED